MATYWWRNASADGNANNAANWDTVETGGGSNAVPGASDYAYFSSTASNTNCTLSADAACSRLYTTAALTGGTGNYTATIDLNGYNATVTTWDTRSGTIDMGEGIVTVGQGGWTSTGATVTARTSTLVFNGGTGAVLLRGGAVFYDLQLKGNTTGTGGSVSYSHSMVLDAGVSFPLANNNLLTATSGASTAINGTLSSAGTGRLDLNDSAAANLTIGGSGSLTATVRFNTTAGNCTVPALTYGGAVEFYNVSTDHRSCILAAGTHNYSSTFSVNASGTKNLLVDGATNNPTVNITGLVDYTGTGAGSEFISWGTGTWTLSGGLNMTGGGSTPGTATVVQAGSAQSITFGGCHLYNLTCNDNTTLADASLIDALLKCIMPSKQITFASSVTHAIGDLNIDGQAVGTRVVFAPGTAATAYNLNLTAAAAPTKISNLNVDYCDATASPAAVKADDGTNLDGGHNVNWTFLSAPATKPYYYRQFIMRPA